MRYGACGFPKLFFVWLLQMCNSGAMLGYVFFRLFGILHPECKVPDVPAHVLRSTALPSKGSYARRATAARCRDGGAAKVGFFG